MDFRIADTFTASLARLTGAEQKAAKTAAFDLQLDPASPGLRFHRLERAKDANFWSVRVTNDLRLIVHKTASSLLLAYVAHHDDAYGWAERRRIERHPTTGAAQLVEVRERIEEVAITVPRAAADVPQERYYPPLFQALSQDDLLGIGVPPDWLEAVRNVTELTVFDLADALPEEAMEALIAYVTTGELQPAAAVDADTDPFDHPDAQRRFRVLDNVEELARALDYPWEKWTVFLHPAQRALVDKSYGGPVRVSGSAGTGKTVVALHRAVALARREPQARVLLTTFSDPLAAALAVKLERLCGNEPSLTSRITVRALPGVAADLYAALFGPPVIAAPETVRDLLAAADAPFAPRFLWGEWCDVVDAWQLASWEDYRDVSRLGRKTRIGGKQREVLWAVFERVRAGLAQRGLVTGPQVFGRLTGHFAATQPAPFDHVVVDEAQDLGVAELRFLAALAGARPEGLFFTGDLGQRIFQQPFSWKSLGVDVRGRAQSLRLNYRTSHQIRSQADRLLPGAIADVDGNSDSRTGTISLFDGPPPRIEVFDGPRAEIEAVGLWLLERLEDGVEPAEIGVFVRSEAQLGRARSAARDAGEEVTVGTMHQAKGLEFRAVAVMACDDEVIPLQERLETLGDDADLAEVYDTERHLLYVACTRARDHLLVTGVDPASEFLLDLAAEAAPSR